jgi:putative membrane protein
VSQGATSVHTRRASGHPAGSDVDRAPESSSEGKAPDAAGRHLVYLAAERTLLTWVRAVVSLIVVGFAVDRFGLWVGREPATAFLGARASTWVGVALIATGIVMSVLSAARYMRFLRRFEQGDPEPSLGLPMAIALALLLALVGAALAAYLWLASAG